DSACDKEGEGVGKVKADAESNARAWSVPGQPTEQDEPGIEYPPFIVPRVARAVTCLHSLFVSRWFTAPDAGSAALALMSGAHGLDDEWQPVMQH
ncbi:hypothetical protein J2R62_18915, partial [Plesiomonas shigelloides]